MVTYRCAGVCTHSDTVGGSMCVVGLHLTKKNKEDHSQFMWVILVSNSSFNSCLPPTGQVSGLGKHFDIGVSCTHICCGL